MVLFLHLFSTSLAIIIGFYLFHLSKKVLWENLFIVLLWVVLLWSTAISGIFLNLVSLSPFHILSIVVLTTTPLALYNFKQHRNIEFRLGLYYNFVGLCLAASGTFYPTRRVGRLVFSDILHLDFPTSVTIFWILMLVTSICAIYGIFKINNPKK